jgi:hypothetical protein
VRGGQDGHLLGQPASAGLTQQSTIGTGISPGISKPAAGSNFTFTCQPYDRWRLVACRFTLSTNATVGDRYPTIEYLGVNNLPFMTDGPPVAVTASTTGQVFAGSLHRSVSEWNNASDVFFPLSGLWLEAGAQIQIAIAGIQTGDQIDLVRLTFDRWPEEPLDYGYENEEAQTLNEIADSFDEDLARMRSALVSSTLQRELANG